ncbi:SAF domain-containing protein [Kineococcus rhizosphaerae]|uniref:Flp pilus assembly protein CpaB n=1 Tax=Kineococcus rhizosphaerae TaxID=559628 RepID=A0A2T0R151_9ACTN|nr:SAF domain-containing protein [Kineococcus rhizosphaerae]PRY12971.1 Flp pilus assembly protein CpaB [Kineococcus rhizosphaerae]
MPEIATAPPAPLGPLDRRRRRLGRRWASAGLVAAAGGVAVSALAPSAPELDAVLVAARDLPTGAVLTAADVERADRPADSLPDGLLTPGAVVGAVLASPVRRGEVLTDTRTTAGPLLTGQPAGTVATTVDVGDPALLPSLAAGTRVDVLARTEDPLTGAATGADRIAVDVVVLRVPAPADASGPLGVPGSPSSPGASVLVAVDAATAARLAAAAGHTVLTVRS